MEEEVRAAVFGNVGTMIVFRVGAYDAEVLEKEFMPTFTAEDIVNLGVYQIYLKLMIDGVSSQPFSATTLPPIALPLVSPADEIKAMSRQQFAHTRPEVEKAINEWMAPIKATPPVPKSPVQSPAPKPVQVNPAPVPPAPKVPTQSLTPFTKPIVAQSPKPFQANPISVPIPPVPRSPLPPIQSLAPKSVQVNPALTPVPSAPKPPVQSTVSVARPPVAQIVPKLSIQAPKPEPTQVKPFAQAFKTMEKDSIPARAKQIEGVDEDLPSITLVKDPNAQKSVPLASLSPAASKVPTPERVSALKAALAKAMEGKVASEIPSPKLQATNNNQIPRNNNQTGTITSSPTSPQTSNIQSLTSAPQPPEIPEDVLRKALKVD
jgi:hypothetical protein